jgi:hypothetical protein
MFRKTYFRLLYFWALITPACLIAQGYILVGEGAQIQSNGGVISVSGNWINNGCFSARSGAVVFREGLQVVEGTRSTVFYNLQIEETSAVELASSNHAVRNRLWIDGILYADNRLTLLADSTQTAWIAGGGQGDVSGHLTMQGYLSRAFGYAYLGSPFQAALVAEMAEDVNLNASFPAVYRFEENLPTNGWVVHTDSTLVLSPMHGYAFQFGTSATPKIISITGTVNNGSLSRTLVSHNQPFTRGFNLVSNPYPSPVNWDAAEGWTKTNIDNAIYRFEADSSDLYGGVYTTYINGISSDGKAGPYIPAMQAFFVHVTDEAFPVTGVLGMDNRVRTGGLDAIPELRHTPDLLRIGLKMKDVSPTDATVFYFKTRANMGFDGQLDAIKLLNTGIRTPSIFGLGTRGEYLAIRALDGISTTLSIPLGVFLPKGGEVVFSNLNPEMIPDGVFCYLYDSEKRVYYDLNMPDYYPAELGSGMNLSRFFVVFRKTPLEDTDLSEQYLSPLTVVLTGSQIEVELDIPFGENADLRLFNMAGQELETLVQKAAGHYVFDAPAVSGLYVVSCLVKKGIFSEKIVVVK